MSGILTSTFEPVPKASACKTVNREPCLQFVALLMPKHLQGEVFSENCCFGGVWFRQLAFPSFFMASWADVISGHGMKSPALPALPAHTLSTMKNFSSLYGTCSSFERF